MELGGSMPHSQNGHFLRLLDQCKILLMFIFATIKREENQGTHLFHFIRLQVGTPSNKEKYIS